MPRRLFIYCVCGYSLLYVESDAIANRQRIQSDSVYTRGCDPLPTQEARHKRVFSFVQNYSKIKVLDVKPAVEDVDARVFLAFHRAKSKTKSSPTLTRMEIRAFTCSSEDRNRGESSVVLVVCRAPTICVFLLETHMGIVPWSHHQQPLAK